MPTVQKPSKNKLNRGFSSQHPAYDFDDVPDNRVFASFDGEVTMVVDRYTNSWVANTPSDPWYPGAGKTRALKTEDYGNMVKVMGKDLIQLSTHFKKGAVVSVGQKVKAGELIGYAGDNSTDTGNSTGGHSHNEYRYKNNTKTTVEFTEGETPTMPANDLDKVLEHFKVKDADELIRVMDQELGFLADERKKTVKLQETIDANQATYNASVGQFKSQADKYKIVRDALLEITGIEVKTATDVNLALEKYYTKVKATEDAAKKETASSDASKEVVKETGRIAILAMYATPISLLFLSGYSHLAPKYNLPALELVQVLPIVTGILRVIDRSIYQLGKSLQNEGLTKSLTRF
jgi:hypothetical protein